MSQMSDDERDELTKLILEAQNSPANPAVIDRLMRRLGLLIPHWVSHRLQNGPGFDVDDVVQETSLKVFVTVQKGEFDPKRSPVGLVRTFADHCVTDAQRKKARSKTIPLPQESAHPADRGRQPDQEAERREEIANLINHIDNLPEKLRDSLRLVYLEGRPYNEAAYRLGIDPTNIKNVIRRARKRLERAIMMRRSFS